MHVLPTQEVVGKLHQLVLNTITRQVNGKLKGLLTQSERKQTLQRQSFRQCRHRFDIFLPRNVGRTKKTWYTTLQEDLARAITWEEAEHTAMDPPFWHQTAAPKCLLTRL